MQFFYSVSTYLFGYHETFMILGAADNNDILMSLKSQQLRRDNFRIDF